MKTLNVLTARTTSSSRPSSRKAWTPWSRFRMSSLKNLLAAIALCVAAPSLFAANVTFTNSSGGDWGVGSNWDNGTGPASGDGAFLTAITNTSYTVTYSTNSGTSPWSLQLENTNAFLTTLNINAAGFATANAGNTVIGHGVVNVNTNGIWTNSSGQISINQGSTVYVNGGSIVSSSTNTSDLVVGHAVSTTNSPALLKIDSGTIDYTPSSKGIRVGNFSKGLLQINGGTVKVGSLYVGTGASGADSKVEFNGGDLQIGGNNLIIGQAANAQMVVTGGTLTNAGSMTIANNTAGVTASVTQSNGTWKQTGDVTIAKNQANTSGSFSLQGGTFTGTNATHTMTVSVGGTTVTNAVGVFEKTGGTLTLDNLTVNQYGYLKSGAAQTWSLYGNFTNNSTKNTQFDMAGATLEFTGSRTHAMTVAGTDFGTNASGYQNNFAIDALSLASTSDKLTLSLTNGGVSGALYLNALLLPGSNTNLISTNITGVNGLNIYYQIADSRNAYLGGQTYNLNGGGQLLGIPEPTPIAFIGLAGLLVIIAVARNRKRNLCR